MHRERPTFPRDTSNVVFTDWHLSGQIDAAAATATN